MPAAGDLPASGHGVRPAGQGLHARQPCRDVRASHAAMLACSAAMSKPRSSRCPRWWAARPARTSVSPGACQRWRGCRPALERFYDRLDIVGPIVGSSDFEHDDANASPFLALAGFSTSIAGVDFLGDCLVMLGCSGIPANWLATIDLLGAQGPFTATPKGRRGLIFGLRLLSPSGADNDRCDDRKEKSFHCFLVVVRAGHDAIVARTRSDDSCVAAVTPPTWDAIVCSRCATPPALRARLPIVHCSEIILAEQHTPVATYFQRADCSKIRHGDHCVARHIVHIERCFGRNDSDRSPFPSRPAAPSSLRQPVARSLLSHHAIFMFVAGVAGMVWCFCNCRGRVKEE
jgi:hypothetical protein